MLAKEKVFVYNKKNNGGYMLSIKEIQKMLCDKNTTKLVDVASKSGVSLRTLQNVKNKGKCTTTTHELLNEYYEKNGVEKDV